MGDPHRAEVTLWEGVLTNPENPRFAAWLVEVYRRIDASSCALPPAGNSPDLACPLVHEQVCSASVNVTRRLREIGQQGAAGRFLETGTKEIGCPAEQYR
jgi:hypothetical protein